MTTSPIITHEEDALARLLQQYKGKSLLDGLITALFTDQIQEAEDAFRELYNRLSITDSEGIQIDNIGDLIGQARLGFDDETYKILVRARIGRNVSEGDIERIISTWKLLTGASIIQLVEVFPAEINLYSDVPISDDLIDIAIELINETAAAGVAIDVIAVYTPSGSFGFDGNPDALGFGSSSDPSIGGTFAYLQTTGTLTIISDPTNAFGFSPTDPNVNGFGDSTDALKGGKFSYIDLS